MKKAKFFENTVRYILFGREFMAPAGLFFWPDLLLTHFMRALSVCQMTIAAFFATLDLFFSNSLLPLNWTWNYEIGTRAE